MGHGNKAVVRYGKCFFADEGGLVCIQNKEVFRISDDYFEEGEIDAEENTVSENEKDS